MEGALNVLFESFIYLRLTLVFVIFVLAGGLGTRLSLDYQVLSCLASRSATRIYHARK